MRIAVGSDERTNLTNFVISHLKQLGHETVCFGATNDNPLSWSKVAEQVAKEVSSGSCQEGIVFCWTGTGVSIAANKIPGIRAALCCDAYTAGGARKWNNANVLALSLRNTSEALAKEILDEWFLPKDIQPDDASSIDYLNNLETKYSPINSKV